MDYEKLVKSNDSEIVADLLGAKDVLIKQYENSLAKLKELHTRIVNSHVEYIIGYEEKCKKVGNLNSNISYLNDQLSKKDTRITNLKNKILYYDNTYKQKGKLFNLIKNF